MCLQMRRRLPGHRPELVHRVARRALEYGQRIPRRWGTQTDRPVVAVQLPVALFPWLAFLRIRRVSSRALRA